MCVRGSGFVRAVMIDIVLAVYVGIPPTGIIVLHVPDRFFELVGSIGNPNFINIDIRSRTGVPVAAAQAEAGMRKLPGKLRYDGHRAIELSTTGGAASSYVAAVGMENRSVGRSDCACHA